MELRSHTLQEIADIRTILTYQHDVPAALAAMKED